jgi:chromosome segregation and condensation protein ScpB
MNQSTSNTRDGFQVVSDHLTVPKDSALDQQTKRTLAICHLFLNRSMAIADIVWLLGVDNGTVVLALLEQGIIQERRRQPRPAPQERRKSIPSLRTTQIYARLRT